MKPTLFLLAAGMGSRYGGLKQLDELGPHGETIMDYSIYDAIQNLDSASWYSLSVRILKKTSVASYCLNMKVTFLANSYSKPSTHCPKVSLAPKVVLSLGVPTTP